MPTYQYACTECGEQLERVQSFSDPALTECPACSGKLRKVFNSVGIVFKGSGFYRTDSRPANGSTDKPATTPATTTSSSDGKSDSSTKPTSTPAPATTSSSTSTSSSTTATTSS
ncbi:hypothetical protein Asp14428_53980 [Actinoplanes sp. NBRC 14428]|uniref:Putative FmdB family regulatory protein n=1 Tax=Pseudosporangium ferrugineum TaxID=439699 RepID=A0A2T0S4W2_9ACTN|nr:FmdB family zinc ribbon protein [Pseudosporangium ferrugineum]PRY28442.1 putative FmdB family regulatory protein [Pseudosporangium ferrugineum]BCJ53923.1 hypothetical protein Asp14428_53980 [Actinoplanes sp. NBRC 14428]